MNMIGSMRVRTGVQVGALSLGLYLPTSSPIVGSAPWPCRVPRVEPCFTHHGRLSSQNGIALKIWLIGTTRVVGLDNSGDDLPPLLRKYLDMTSPDHSYIYGDFDICPTESDKPGHLRRVCVAGADRLVVQDVRGVRPAFRLRSTWPAGERNGAMRERP
jgi:hypothetical protein